MRLNLLSLHPKSSEQLWKKPESSTRHNFSPTSNTSFSVKKKNPASEELTFVGAEAIFAVFVEVVAGGAPQEAVVAALRRAAVILGAHEQEGEFAELSISVAVFHLHHCRRGSRINDLQPFRTSAHLQKKKRACL